MNPRTRNLKDAVGKIGAANNSKPTVAAVAAAAEAAEAAAAAAVKRNQELVELAEKQLSSLYIGKRAEAFIRRRAKDSSRIEEIRNHQVNELRKLHNTLREWTGLNGYIDKKSLASSLLPCLVKHHRDLHKDLKAEYERKFSWLHRLATPERFQSKRLRDLREEKRNARLKTEFYELVEADAEHPRREYFCKMILKNYLKMSPDETSRLPRIPRSIRRSMSRRQRRIPTIDCAVCMEIIRCGPDAEEAVALPCDVRKHQAHLKCAHKWLRINSTCPLCRKPCYTLV